MKKKLFRLLANKYKGLIFKSMFNEWMNKNFFFLYIQLPSLALPMFNLLQGQYFSQVGRAKHT